jgi:hypothetical protein
MGINVLAHVIFLWVSVSFCGCTPANVFGNESERRKHPCLKRNPWP